MWSVDLASRHLILGIGMGNFHIYSLKGYVAHNSYLEVSAEFGVAGLIAYLTFILSPLRSLKRVEVATSRSRKPREREFYYLSVGLQATIWAYLVCSFFASIQYFWYLYQIVAYSIALQMIYASEKKAVSGAYDRAAEPLASGGAALKSGELWK
jgi:O-antigen ligase